jgi:hypothetical protein
MDKFFDTSFAAVILFFFFFFFCWRSKLKGEDGGLCVRPGGN